MRQPNWPLYIYMYTLPLIIFGLFFFTKFILYKLQYSVQSFVSLRLVCTLWRQVAYTCTQPVFPWEIRKLSIKLVIQNADKTLVHGGKEGGDRSGPGIHRTWTPLRTVGTGWKNSSEMSRTSPPSPSWRRPSPDCGLSEWPIPTTWGLWWNPCPGGLQKLLRGVETPPSTSQLVYLQPKHDFRMK